MGLLSGKERKRLSETIRDIYGNSDFLSNLGILKTSNRDRLWLVSKKIFEVDMQKLRVQSAGMYFGRFDNGMLRLSIEGAQLIGKTAKKNIVEISKDDVWHYMRGFNIKPIEKINTKNNSYVLVRHEKDILGIAKLVNDELQNVLPKSRKLISLTKEKNLYDEKG
jgi:NOL1/NOP2/fmu family ribosome biogenesis protein